MIHVAGVDEAGRGPLAGPVVVAAVILDARRPISGLADSKTLTEARRNELDQLIRAQAVSFCVVEIDHATIDRLNILQATLRGMRKALLGLNVQPHEALIDGNRLPNSLPCAARAIVDGDALFDVIGAASILAKVHRDRLLTELDVVYPGYGFAEHKGYPTPTHLAALERLGPCPVHRRSFAPVRRLFDGDLFATAMPTP